MGERVECPVCEGVKWAPCDCSYCRTPEGRAYGRIGHHGHTCDACDEDGMVYECCGLPDCECLEIEQEAAA